MLFSAVLSLSSPKILLLLFLGRRIVPRRRPFVLPLRLRLITLFAPFRSNVVVNLLFRGLLVLFSVKLFLPRQVNRFLPFRLLPLRVGLRVTVLFGVQINFLFKTLKHLVPFLLLVLLVTVPLLLLLLLLLLDWVLQPFINLSILIRLLLLKFVNKKIYYFLSLISYLFFSLFTITSVNLDISVLSCKCCSKFRSHGSGVPGSAGSTVHGTWF